MPKLLNNYNLKRNMYIYGRNHIFILVITFFALIMTPVSGVIYAEIIYLKNGEIEVGKIVGQSPDYILIQKNGIQSRVNKKDVRQINFQSTPEDEENAKNQKDIDAMLEWQGLLNVLLEQRREEHANKEKEWVDRGQEEADFFTDEIKELKKRKREGALRRSLLLPGWGQFYKDQDWKAYSVIGMSILAAGISYYSYNQYASLSNEYNDSTMQFAALFYLKHNFLISYINYKSATARREEMINNSRNGKILLGTVGIIYLINVVDSYWTDVDLNIENEFALGENSGRWTLSMEPGVNNYTEKTYTIGYSMQF